MKNDTRRSGKSALYRVPSWVVVLFCSSLLQGVQADESVNPVMSDLQSEIKLQGALALQAMTLDLKRDMDWNKRGVEELEVTMRGQLISSDQIANHIDMP